jgi:hypothetical protein
MSAFTGLDFGWDFPPADGDLALEDSTDIWDTLANPAPQQPAGRDPPAPSHQRASSAPLPLPAFFVPPPHVRESSLPAEPPPPGLDDEFPLLCRDPLVSFDAKALGFIPADVWPREKYTFGDLVTDFFRRKSSGSTRFLHKLYNALRIVQSDAFYADVVGIEWVSDQVIKVSKRKFGRLLGIRAIEGSLFHQQGSFPAHGFRELGPAEARELVSPQDLEDVDFDEVRLLVHAAGAFARGSPAAPYLVPRWQYGRPGR